MGRSFPLGHLALAVGLALGSTQTFAAEETSAVEEENIEQIVVVGSRAAPRSVADSPVPVDVVGGDELAKSGSADMLDLLQAAVPSFKRKTAAYFGCCLFYPTCKPSWFIFRFNINFS